MTRYRTKPVYVEAERFDPEDEEQRERLKSWGVRVEDRGNGVYWIVLPEDDPRHALRCLPGMFIVMDSAECRLMPAMDEDAFVDTYESADMEERLKGLLCRMVATGLDGLWRDTAEGKRVIDQVEAAVESYVKTQLSEWSDLVRSEIEEIRRSAYEEVQDG